MAAQAAAKEQQFEQMTAAIRQGAAKEHRPRWVYASMAAKAWGVPDDVMSRLVTSGVVPTHVVENPNEPKVTYVDAAVAPIKDEDALRWGCAKPEKITYKVSAPVRAKAAEAMALPEWGRLVELYESGVRWTDETEDLLAVIGRKMESVLPNTGNTAGINGILMHAVHTNDAGECIRIVRALASTAESGKKHKGKGASEPEDAEEAARDDFDEPDDDDLLDDEA